LTPRSQIWSQELSGKVSFTAGCSRFYINVASTRKSGYVSTFIKNSGLWDHGHGQQFAQFVGSFIKCTALLFSK